MQPNIVSLEKAQQGHNRVITAVGNNSGSGDPTQHKHDLNDKLIKSAEAFAAGKTLGMSEEETLAAMSRMLRRQQRADDTVTMNDIERQLVQSAASIREVSPGAELKGVRLREEPEVDPFGQDQGEYYTYGPDDTQYNDQQISKMSEAMSDMEDLSSGQRRYDRSGNVVLRSGENPVEYDDLGLEIDRLKEPSKRDSVAPSSVLTDALGQLRAAKQQQSGFRGALSRVFGGGGDGLADAEGRLEQLIDPRIDRAAQASLVTDMSRADQAGMNYRRAAYNNIMGQIEAEQIGERMYRPYRPGAVTTAMVADESLGAIRSGTSQMPDAGRAGFSQIGPVAPVGVGEQSWGAAIDPGTGNALGAIGPQYVTPNTEPSAALNAPITTQSWMVQKQPGYREGGRVFGDYPQVDVTGATTLLANRLRGVEGFGNISPNVRGVGELQRAVEMAARGGNVRFATREPVTDAQGNTKLKSVKQANPDVRGLLSALRYTPAQESELANALYQLETAKATTINQQGKQQFFTRTGPNGSLEPTEFGARTPGGAGVYFDSPEAIDPREGQAKVARVNPGQTIEGRDIKTALGKLNNPEAAMPFIGAVAVTDPETGKTDIEQNAGPGYRTRYNTTGESSIEGIEGVLREKEERNQRNRAKKSGGRIAPVDEKGLRGKVVKAALVQERADRENTKRSNQMSTIISNLPPAARRSRIR